VCGRSVATLPPGSHPGDPLQVSIGDFDHQAPPGAAFHALRVDSVLEVGCYAVRQPSLGLLPVPGCWRGAVPYSSCGAVPPPYQRATRNWRRTGSRRRSSISSD
jgi:hypothetical protein